MRLVAAEEKLVLSLSLLLVWVIEAERESPFDSVSVFASEAPENENRLPVIASDASVIGSLDGAVTPNDFLSPEERGEAVENIRALRDADMI